MYAPPNGEMYLKSLKDQIATVPVHFSSQSDDYLADWCGKSDGVETKRLVDSLPFTVSPSHTYTYMS